MRIELTTTSLPRRCTTTVLQRQTTNVLQEQIRSSVALREVRSQRGRAPGTTLDLFGGLSRDRTDIAVSNTEYPQTHRSFSRILLKLSALKVGGDSGNSTHHRCIASAPRPLGTCAPHKIVGGRCRDRTCDHTIIGRVLYQLS